MNNWIVLSVSRAWQLELLANRGVLIRKIIFDRTHKLDLGKKVESAKPAGKFSMEND